jgi:hypothetical protein
LKNQILVEWLDSKDKGSRNRVNVKHIEQGKGAIRVGICVSVKLVVCATKCKSHDRLAWKTPTKKTRSSAKASISKPKNAPVEKKTGLCKPRNNREVVVVVQRIPITCSARQSGNVS